MLDLNLKQSWVDASSDASLEEFKSAFVDFLNTSPIDRHTGERWSISKVSEGDVALFIYDEQPIANFKIEPTGLHFWADQPTLPRYDDIMFAARATARRLSLSVYSNTHHGARLPVDPSLALDHTFLSREQDFARFFAGSQFVPRYCSEFYETQGDQATITINPPFYLEHKPTGQIHIANYPMLDYLVKKDNQQLSPEFSYQVADSMNDFAKKYDIGLIPANFYQNYNRSIKLINSTYFDIDNIDRKVFIDPYIWDFDADHSPKFYQNVKNGLHLMDKVRNGETLDIALKRMLAEEFKVADDYVGAKVWGIDFDRDREGILTPRLKMNVFVQGMHQHQRSKDHDWVSVK